MAITWDEIKELQLTGDEVKELGLAWENMNEMTYKDLLALFEYRLKMLPSDSRAVHATVKVIELQLERAESAQKDAEKRENQHFKTGMLVSVAASLGGTVLGFLLNWISSRCL